MNSKPTILDQPNGSGSKPLASGGAWARSPDTLVVPVGDSGAELEDRAIHFEDLVERCMGNLELATRLLAQSESHLASDLDLLQQCMESDEPNEVARLAHRLKGATANIGAYQLSDVFARIEQQGGLGETASVPDCQADLKTQWARFIECAADLCGKK